MPRNYAYLKSHGLCVICGHSRADPGYTTCLVCRMDKRAKGETHKTESKYHHQQWLKRRRDIQYAFGVCVTCGKRDAMTGKSICQYCAASARQRAERNRREKGILPRDTYTKDGICWFCDSPSMPGKKVCSEHYAKSCRAMEIARESRTMDNLFELRQKSFWEEKNAIKIQYTGREGERHPENHPDQGISGQDD